MKLCNTVSLPVLLSLNTVPNGPSTPPPSVVPYRFPSASWITPQFGWLPSAQLSAEQKLYSTVSLPVLLSLNTVPQPKAPPL